MDVGTSLPLRFHCLGFTAKMWLDEPLYERWLVLLNPWSTSAFGDLLLVAVWGLALGSGLAHLNILEWPSAVLPNQLLLQVWDCSIQEHTKKPLLAPVS